MKLKMKFVTRAISALALAIPLVSIAAIGAVQAQKDVLRVVPHADLKNLDPIWTTAYITRNHGYMVYDTLIALDAKLEPQPQMLEGGCKWFGRSQPWVPYGSILTNFTPGEVRSCARRSGVGVSQ